VTWPQRRRKYRNRNGSKRNENSSAKKRIAKASRSVMRHRKWPISQKAGVIGVMASNGKQYRMAIIGVAPYVSTVNNNIKQYQ